MIDDLEKARRHFHVALAALLEHTPLSAWVTQVAVAGSKLELATDDIVAQALARATWSEISNELRVLTALRSYRSYNGIPLENYIFDEQQLRAIAAHVSKELSAANV